MNLEMIPYNHEITKLKVKVDGTFPCTSVIIIYNLLLATFRLQTCTHVYSPHRLQLDIINTFIDETPYQLRNTQSTRKKDLNTHSIKVPYISAEFLGDTKTINWSVFNLIQNKKSRIYGTSDLSVYQLC